MDNLVDITTHHASCSPSPFYLREEDTPELLAAFSAEHMQRFRSLELESKELKQKLERVHEAMFDLRAQHNASLPVSRLPNEILSKIMVLTLRNNRNIDLPFLSGKSEWPLACSQVCVLWRQVAFMTSKLWNLIDLRKPKLALALCKRFPKTELRVTYVSRNLADFETLERIILRYPSRISVLHVKGIKPKIDTFMSQFQTCAPALTILHLTRDTTVPWDAAHQNSFFECLTGVDCSKLRYLCMRGFSSHSLWISRWLRSLELRDLEISQMHESDDEPLDDVLDALEALPFLERLCLSRGGSYELLTAPSVRSSRKVHLCRLRELDLAGPTRSCASLLKHLKIADSAKLEVKCWSECSAYFADIWQETQPYCLGPVVALDMHISDVSLCSTGRARRGGPTLVLALDGASPEEGDSILQQLGSCQLLSSNATIFALNKREGTLRPRSLSSLQNILANAEGLQHLSLKGLGAAEYAFRALHNLHAAGDGSHIALPNLATLRIIDAEHSSGQLWFGLCCAELIRRHAFALRHGKAPLQNVKIAHCSGLDRTALGLLEELATKVVVDPSPDDDDSDTSDNVSIRSDYADGDMEQSD